MARDKLLLMTKDGKVLKFDLKDISCISLPRTHNGKKTAVKIDFDVADVEDEIRRAYRALKKDVARYKKIQIKIIKNTNLLI